MSNAKRQRMLLLVAGLALALWVADRLVLTPFTARWKERSTRIADLKQSVTQGSLLLDREEAIRSRWHSMETNALPGQPSAAETLMLKSFERWAQQSGLGLANMNPQWNRVDTHHMTLLYRADGFGSLGSITRFLYELENDALAYKLESMAIRAQNKEGRQLALSIQLSGLLLNPIQP